MMLRILSLGGGVQSTVMALMAAEGRFGAPPDHAIFADTGWEPKGVYENVEWLKSVLPYPVHVVQSHYTLIEDCENARQAEGNPGFTPPAFVKNGDGRTGMLWRQCTEDYKVLPIKRKIRDLMGVSRRARVKPGSVEQWLGISRDEPQRMKPSKDKWISIIWPLVDAGLTRNDCRRWFAERYPGRQLSRSACVGCPYHSAREWIAARKADPEMWERTVRLDTALREGLGEKGGIKKPVFLHRRCLPLNEAVDTDEAMLASRPLLFDQDDGWGNECSGHCGV